jgi:hypothetical protein
MMRAISKDDCDLRVAIDFRTGMICVKGRNGSLSRYSIDLGAEDLLRLNYLKNVWPNCGQNLQHVADKRW